VREIAFKRYQKVASSAVTIEKNYSKLIATMAAEKLTQVC
jgi:hypothetical protein